MTRRLDCLMISALFLTATAVAGCAQMAAGAPGAAAAQAGAATPSASFGTEPMVDQNGLSWQPRVLRRYVSAAGHECLSLGLTPIGAGVPVRRAACFDKDQWQVLPPLALTPGEPDPRFTPFQATAVAPASSNTTF